MTFFRSRRQMLQQTGFGLGALALPSLFSDAGWASRWKFCIRAIVTMVITNQQFLLGIDCKVNKQKKGPPKAGLFPLFKCD